MRTTALCFLTLLALSATRVCEAAPLHEDRAKEIAKQAVFEAVKDSLPPNQKIARLRVNVLPFAGNSSNPITGRSIHRVYVDQELTDAKPSLAARARHRFSKYRERSFDVKVCDKGTACIFSEQTYSPQARAGRWLDKRVPVRPLVKEVFASDKAMELGFALAASGASMAVQPALAAAAIPFAINTVMKARKTARATQDSAVDTTVEWAKAWHKDRGAHPTLAQTYSRYKEALAQSGLQPVQGFEFAQKLALKGL